MFEGTFTALITPFRDGGIDESAFESLVEDQVAAGVDGIVVCGTTGESPTLTTQEQDRLLAIALEKAKGKVAVVAGTGSNDTATTVRRTHQAIEGGADAVMVVTPYYNKPGARGLMAHYETVAEASSVPILLYNIPGRTGSRLPVDVTRELAKNPRVAAMKDATQDPSEVMALVSAGIPVLSGDDALTLPWMALGARGVVSVASNVVPKEVGALVSAAAKGELADARQWHYRLLPLFHALFREPNPVPAKALLNLLGRCTADVRLPLVQAEQSTIDLLRRTWEEVRRLPAQASA